MGGHATRSPRDCELQLRFCKTHGNCWIMYVYIQMFSRVYVRMWLLGGWIIRNVGEVGPGLVGIYRELLRVVRF